MENYHCRLMEEDIEEILGLKCFYEGDYCLVVVGFFSRCVVVAKLPPHTNSGAITDRGCSGFRQGLFSGTQQTPDSRDSISIVSLFLR